METVAKSSLRSALLNEDEIARYHRDGYVVPRYRLPAAELAGLQELTRQLVDDNPELRDKMYIGPHVASGGFQKLRTPRATEWMAIASSPPILDVMEQLIGPDIILWSAILFYKRAGGGPATPWHRDGADWPIKPLSTTTVWIAVYDSVIENGCLRCIPGSHVERKLGRHTYAIRPNEMFRVSLDSDQLDEAQARDVELQAGEMVIFDVYTIHGATPNLGQRPRAGYALRFMPATSRYDHDDRPNRAEAIAGLESRPLFLLRGRDRAENDLRRGHEPIAPGLT